MTKKMTAYGQDNGGYYIEWSDGSLSRFTSYEAWDNATEYYSEQHSDLWGPGEE
jgi:hypothetical protein